MSEIADNRREKLVDTTGCILDSTKTTRFAGGTSSARAGALSRRSECSHSRDLARGCGDSLLRQRENFSALAPHRSPFSPKDAT